jgi:hypothetical protein
MLYPTELRAQPDIHKADANHPPFICTNSNARQAERDVETDCLQRPLIEIFRQRHFVPVGHMALPPWICKPDTFWQGSGQFSLNSSRSELFSERD